MLHRLIFLMLFSFVSSEDETCSDLQRNCNAYLLNGTINYPNYADLRTPELIKQFGYPVEVHNISTQDGYIVTSHRIPYSNASTATTGKIPVFLMHGMFASSAQWFWQPPNRALVFMLADAGYDVWIGNARGTTYSTASTILDPNNSKNLTFWNFSQHEMGKYDIPAIINYITTTTGQPSIYYIGHSLGSTQFFIAMTLNSTLKTKVRTFFGLAPVSYTGNATNPAFRAAAPLYSQYAFQQTVNTQTKGRLLPSALQNHIVNFTDYCANSALDCSACSFGLLLLFGIDSCQTNFTTLPGVLAHLPDTVSSKTFSHDMQAFQDGTFKQYDYGSIGNKIAYGKLVAPDYDWSNYDVNSVFFHSDNDKLAVPMDVNRTANAIGHSLKEINRIPIPAWNHLDFIIAKDADKYVYNRIIHIMNEQLYG